MVSSAAKGPAISPKERFPPPETVPAQDLSLSPCLALQGKEKARLLRPSEASEVKGLERLGSPTHEKHVMLFIPLPHTLGRGHQDRRAEKTQESEQLTYLL